MRRRATVCHSEGSWRNRVTPAWVLDVVPSCHHDADPAPSLFQPILDPGEDLSAAPPALRPLSDFARDLRRIATANDLPEYHLTIYAGARGDPCLHAVRRTLLAPGHQAFDPELLLELGKRRTRMRA